MLVQIALKSTLLLAAALVVTASMRRSSSAARHLVWASALLATLAVPPIVLLGPEWSVAVPPALVPRFDPGGSHPSGTAQVARVERSANSESTRSADARNRPQWSNTLDASPIVIVVWLLGTVFGLARVVAGVFWATRLTWRAVPVTDWAWSLAAMRVAESMGVARPALRASSHATVPLTWGLCRRSVIVLPLEAESWPADRRHAVLLHEMAHVRRHDCLVRSLARVACASQWFNPLAHLAMRRLHAEQEGACDDVVLEAGLTAPDYADHLLEIVRASVTTAAPSVALAMGRRSELEKRMSAILDDTRLRQASSHRTRLIVTAAAVVAVIGVGTLRLSGAQNAAIAPHVTGLRTGAAGRMDFSQIEWTRPVEEETRRTVAGALTAALRDRDERVRAAAQQALDAIAQIPGGTVLVSSPCRGNCVGEVGDPLVPSALAFSPHSIMFEMRTKQALLELQSSDSAVRQRAVGRLMGWTESSAVALAELLQDTDRRVRTLAAMHLDSVVFPPAVPGWIVLLGDSDESLRERAAISLGAIGDPSAIDPLTSTMLNDASPDVRRQAARSLGQIAAGG
jgi:beta-lactamase regulating signal transducer with metallopeptidase domain